MDEYAIKLKAVMDHASGLNRFYIAYDGTDPIFCEDIPDEDFPYESLVHIIGAYPNGHDWPNILVELEDPKTDGEKRFYEKYFSKEGN